MPDQIENINVTLSQLVSNMLQFASTGAWNEVESLVKVVRSYNTSHQYLEYCDGMCRLLHGDVLGGIAAFNRELELFPENVQVYDLLAQVLAKLPLYDINALSRDLSLHTREIRKSNDFYGHAYTLKKYLGLKSSYIIQAVIEHGCAVYPYYWLDDIVATLPHIFVWSEFRRQVYKSNNPDKVVSKIGPMVCYADSILGDEDIKSEKARLGKNVLLVPSHSTVWIDNHYDVQETIDCIEELKKEFNSVRVCLYWKDVQNGIAQYYQQAGIECVCCGQMYDPNFLRRQRAFYEIADIVIVSDPLCSAVSGALGLGKPVCIMKQKFEDKPKVEGFKENIALTSLISDPTNWIEDRTNELCKIFNSLDLQISNEQKEFGAYYLGTFDVKTKEELHDLFLRAEADTFRL